MSDQEVDGAMAIICQNKQPAVVSFPDFQQWWRTSDRYGLPGSFFDAVRSMAA